MSIHYYMSVGIQILPKPEHRERAHMCNKGWLFLCLYFGKFQSIAPRLFGRCVLKTQVMCVYFIWNTQHIQNEYTH